jgi:glycogen operon protein
LLALRHREPLLRHACWFTGERGEAGLAWHAPDGRPMSREDWKAPAPAAFACELRAAGPGAARLLVLFNPQPAAQRFHLPPGQWTLLLDSSGTLSTSAPPSAHRFDAPARTLALLRSASPSPA